MAKSVPTANNDKLIGTDKNDTIDGLAGNDTITGVKGDDSLRGGVGADSIDGGVGKDKLFGDAGNDTLLGGADNDLLDGGTDNDKLDGGAGADTLIGGTGIDTLIGGDHNDLYIVDNSGDVIIETATKTSGIDTVQSSVDYTLALNLENLTLTGMTDLKGIGNDGKNVITGNDGNNLLDGKNGFDTLIGGAGDDTLLGGGGVDLLIGGDGSDTYQISSNEDKIVETAKDGDEDVVESSVSYTLGDNLEVLTLIGAAAIDATGNELANTLEGNTGANRLRGEAGDDTLQGYAGNDTLEGGTGDDVIDGGDGIDQVIYQGNEDDYKIFFDADSATWVVEDVNGTDGDGVDEGRDEITGVESMVFADKGVIDLTQGLTLSINNISQLEGTGADSSFNFTVSLSTASTAPVSVNYSVQGGTATAGTDFTTLSGVLTFSPNETEKTLSVPVKADTLTENDETFTVVLSNPVGASLVQASGVGTIQNDDQGSLSISAISLNEGNSGSQDAILTVTLSAASSQPVTVNYATADGSATAGSDYTTKNGAVTFPAGSTSQQIRIPVTGDTNPEGDENFSVNLSGAVNAVIAAASATVTLKNDDQAVLSIASTQITEGNAGSQNVELTINLSAPTNQPVSVDYTTANGTAMASSDYTAMSGTLNFPVGTTSQKISIPVTGDTQVEANETFTVTLGRAQNATVSGVAGTATVTLINDDQPSLSIADVSLNEGNSGTQEAVLTVTLLASSPQTVSVDYATANFSAVAGSDYTTKTGTLSFPAGTTTQQIRIPVTGDTLVEPDESFTVSLSNAVNALLGTSKTATVTLTNDDIPQLSIAPVQVQEGNSGTTEAIVTVSLSSASNQVVSVNYGTADGTALAGSDYSPVSGNLTFNPGETRQQVRVLVNGDTDIESDETLTVSLSNAQGALLDSTKGQATVTISNDDRPLELSITSIQLSEGNNGTSNALLTVNLSKPTADIVTVNYLTMDGTAIDQSDYMSQIGVLNFAPGETIKTISIPIVGDTKGEQDEIFSVSLSGAKNAALNASATTAIVTILDDDSAGKPFVSNGGMEMDLSNSPNKLSGTPLNDRINGLGGNDVLDGGAGDDSLTGGTDNDSLTGNIGDDTLDGGSGNDTLYGNDGNDRLFGGEGYDYMNGGYGNDYLDGRINTIQIGSKGDTLVGDDGDDTLIGGKYNDELSGDYGSDLLIGGDGNDTIYGGAGGGYPSNDTIDGGSGNDEISTDGFDGSSRGSLYVRAGDGDDTLDIHEVYGSLIQGESGDDFIVVQDYGSDKSANTIDGGDGNDFIETQAYSSGGNFGYNIILGGDGNDTIGDPDYSCMDTNEQIDGGSGNDFIYAGWASDTVTGNTGIDTLMGGDGDDAFVFNKGDSGRGKGNRDIIKDFDSMSAFEVIDIHNLTNTTLNFKGTAPFDGNNQVRYTMDITNDSTIIQINLDADIATIEMEIELTGIMGLTATDFVLAATA